MVCESSVYVNDGEWSYTGFAVRKVVPIV